MRIHRHRQLGEVPVTHLAAADVAPAGGGIEDLVDPLSEGAVVTEHRLGIAADLAEVVVRRVDLGGERAGVEASAARQHREAADTAAAQPVKVRLAVAVVCLIGAAAGVEEHLIALEHAVRMGAGPLFEAGVSRRW